MKLLSLRFGLQAWCGWMLGVTLLAQAVGQETSEYPPHDKILEGFTRAESRSPDHQALGNIYTRERDSQMYLELPKDFATKKYFIALTVSSGDDYAGLQAGDY
ncbi:MAG: hypothetical protein ACK53L_16015, partial [Pirellulaceae bacterium]